MPEPGSPQLETPPDLNQFARSIVDYLVSVENIQKIWGGQEPVLVKMVEVALGSIIGLLGTIGAEFAKAIVNAEDIAEPAFKRLANVAFKDITGLDANFDTRGGGRDGRSGTARNLGAGILQALSGLNTAAGSGGGALTPSTKAAEDYLTFVVQMSLEGWLTGLMGEMMTLGAVENLGDLDDALANTLGLARTSRAVMRPFINTTVSIPAQWKMNQLYRPELLSPALAVKMFHRGRWTREQLFEELSRQGWSDDRIEGMIADAQLRPSLAQVLRAFELEYITLEDARVYLFDLGYTTDIADFILTMEEVDDIGKFQEDLAQAAAAAYVARRITPAKFNQLLSDTSLPTRQAARLRELSELKRALNTKTLSESDAEAAAKRKIISIPEYRKVLVALGYDEQAVYVKELLLQGDINSAEQREDAARRRSEELAAAAAERKRLAAERKAALDLERAVTEPTLGMVERFVTRGRWTFQQYEQFLQSERYDATTIAALVADAEEARAGYIAQQEARAAAETRAATRTIGLADLEDAVLRGHATMADYRARLAADKYVADDQAKLVAVLQDRIDERAELQRRRDELNNRTDDKGLSVAQFEAAVLKGISSLADYDAFLRGRNVADFDRSVLLRLLEQRIADQADNAARRDEVEAAAAARNVRVADIRRAVLTGIRDIADYRNALIDARVPADDRQLLEELLQAELTARRAAEDLRDQANRDDQARGLSLAQLERGVIAGAATPEQYEQRLVDDGYDDDAIVTLMTLLHERIEATQRARRRRDELENEDGGRPLAPAQIARAVKAGIRTTQDYFLALLADRTSEEDAQLLTQLLELELAEANDARARRTVIAGELADESINLAQLAAAVRAGTATLQSYGEILTARGYQPADVATLVALLEREIDEAAAAGFALEEATEGDKVKQLSVSQFEKAVTEGARTVVEFASFLAGQGFSLAAQSSLVSLLLQRLDKAAGAARE